MVWFQCEDCGENLKKRAFRRHFSFCSATKLSCIDCGNMFGQDSVQCHNQCMTKAEKYGPKGQSKPSYGTPAKPKDNSKQQPDFDIYVGLSNRYPWFCSLCNAKASCKQNLLAHADGKKHRAKAKELADKQKQQPTIDKENSRQQPDFDINDNWKQLPDFNINVGLSNCYPWFCSLCNTKATSQQSLLSHAYGKKHRENVEGFDAKEQQRQPKHSSVNKDYSKQQTKFDINVGLSNRHPWFCSLCNTKASSQQSLLSHANGKKHRANVESFDAKQQQQLELSMVDKKDTIENYSDGDSEQNKVDVPVSSGVANGYSQANKKRKLEAFNETWNGEVVQAEESKGESEKRSESKKAKKQDYEKKDKKQTEPDSDFEYDKEDIKMLLLSYSKEELVNLVYKTAEKGSRLISAILKSADRDIAQRNIFVRGFGWDTTHENLKAAFECYGEIEECSVVMDKDTGRGKGYGFVLFKTRKGAIEALKNPEKRMYNRIVVCNLASAKPCGVKKVQDNVETVKINLKQMANQSEATFPGHELALGQNMPYYGHSQLPDFDPMYGSLSGHQMVAGQPNYCMFGLGMMNQGSMLPPNHMGMAGQYFGDGEHAWYQR